MGSRLTALLALSMAVAATLGAAQAARAATITWKGHTWNVTNGGMAGVCQGNAANVSIDANGYLHMKIVNNGGSWTAAEIFSTDKLGFGTYQWQIEGAIDKLDKNVVVGLFPYGPEAGLGQSGNNEIDIEFAHWGNDAWPNGNYTVWPPTGTNTGEYTFTLSLAGGTALTTRFTWSSTKIDFATLAGFVAVDASTGLLDAWTFAPANPTTRITQEAMPLGMNLWCFDNPPSDGKNVEIVVRDFQFVPLGGLPDAGSGASDGSQDVAGSAGNGGSTGTGNRDGSANGDVRGSGAGGAAASGGSASGGALGTGGGTAGAAGGTGRPATGGSAGSAGSATGGVASTGGLGTGGTPGAGGLAGTGGAGTTGRGGTGGTTAPMGSGDGGGLPGSGGAAGAGDVASLGGVGGGSSGSGPAQATSGGCTCAVAGTRIPPGWSMLAIVVAPLLAGCRARRRGRSRSWQ